ncbi:unnamed protein product [Leuciscus chuanchicus]
MEGTPGMALLCPPTKSTKVGSDYQSDKLYRGHGQRMASKFPELPVPSDEIFQSGYVPRDTCFIGQDGCGPFEVPPPSL